MDEYISREAAVNFAKHAYNEWNLAMATADGQRQINLVYKRQELCKAVESVFSSVPGDDVAPVVHGEWMRRRSILWHYCSICLEDALMSRSTGAEVLSGTCPHCGARMDGKQNEQAN